MRTALIDADIVAYKAAAKNEQKFEFGDEVAVSLDKKGALKDAREMIECYAQATKADKVLICLSDPDKNFRKEVCEDYKNHRKNTKRPELLIWVKEYLFQNYRSLVWPRLEADDVMGIIQTAGDDYVKGQTVIVSEDKDMRTVPGLLYNPNKEDLGVIDVSYSDAVRWHLEQTIIGDPTDGYKGCPRLGPKCSYVARINDPQTPLEDLWDIVVEAFESKGLTEDDALLQARQAYILWNHAWNQDTYRLKLWRPSWITKYNPKKPR